MNLLTYLNCYAVIELSFLGTVRTWRCAGSWSRLCSRIHTWPLNTLAGIRLFLTLKRFERMMVLERPSCCRLCDGSVVAFVDLCSLVCRSFDLCQLATPRPPPCRSTSFLFPFSAFRLGLNFCSHVFSLACLCRAAIRLSLFLSRFCWCACW